MGTDVGNKTTTTQAVKTSSAKTNVVPPEITKQTWKNLRKTIDELRICLRPADTNDQDDSPPTKRQKVADIGNEATTKNSNNFKKKPKELYTIVDPYNLYRHTIRLIGYNDDENDDDEDIFQIEDDAARDLKTTAGGKLSQLTLSGLINGLSGHHGGIVNKKNK